MPVERGSTTSASTAALQDPQFERRRSSDPYLGLQFWVDLGENIVVAGFRECSGLAVETETFEYAEGGLNNYVHKLPTRTKYTNITLKKGIDDGRDLLEWYTKTINGAPDRKNISIILFDSTMKQVRRWDLREAYPVKWMGPDLTANSGSVAVESIELAHSGLLPSSITSGPPELPPQTNFAVVDSANEGE